MAWINKNTLSALFFFPVLLFAYKDLGVFGPQYEITEPHLMNEIKKAASELNKTAMKKQIGESYESGFRVDYPIRACDKNTTRMFRPNYTVKEDIVYPDGTIAYKKGYSFNPLSRMQFNENITFFNADAPEQTSLALKNSSLLLITKGDIKKLEKTYKKRFDPAIPKYLESFNIRCVPTIVKQQNDALILEEISAKELGK